MKKQIDWTNTLFLTLTPLLALIFLVLHFVYEPFSLELIVLGIFLACLSGFSITGGYHRLWAHRAYKANRLVKIFYAIFGATAFQNSILKWSSDHRVHHQGVDTDVDPYNINKGFWYAHVLWVCEKATRENPIPKDLANDPVVAWQHKYYIPIAVLFGMFLPALLGFAMGLPLGGLAFLVFGRIVAVHHSTFFINSLCHILGSRPYSLDNSARDNGLIAFFTFGEGYHNFHHAFQADYRNGIRWYHWDPTKWIVKTLSYVGLTSNLRVTKESEIYKAKFSVSLAQRDHAADSLKSRLNDQAQEKLEQLKSRLEKAQENFHALRRDYEKLKADGQKAAREKIDELKLHLEEKKREIQQLLHEWDQTLALA